jgi:hypothetical protein
MDSNAILQISSAGLVTAAVPATGMRWVQVGARVTHHLGRGARVAIWLMTWATLSSSGCTESSKPDNANDNDASEQNLLPEELDGLFHLVGDVGDANPTSLRLVADGTFAWGVSGCDYLGGDVGIWTREADNIVLHPSEGRERFLWSKEHVVGPVERVVIAANEAGLEATPPSEPAQQWQPGGVCPVCSTYEAIACDDPYLAEEPSISRAVR